MDGNPQAALEFLQKNPPAPGQEQAHRDLIAHTLVALRQYDAAYPLLLNAAAERGMDYDIYLALAETEANLGLSTHAERRIKRLTQAFPNNPAVQQARDFGLTIRKNRDVIAAAIRADARALEEAMYYQESTYLPFREGNYGAVIDACRLAIERCPEYAPAYLTLSQALALSGDIEGAIDALKQIAGPKTAGGAQATADLVRMLLSLGRREEAEQAAEPLLTAATVPETRQYEAETVALLGDHEEVRDLLGSQRDLSPREHFLLGIANANMGDLPSARREIQAAAERGYVPPFLVRSLEMLDDGKTDLSYFPVLDRATPALALAIQNVLRQPNPEAEERLRNLVLEQPEFSALLDRYLEEDPINGVRVMAAIGTPEALQRMRDVAFDEENGITERLIALSGLRDAGEIAQDEPVEITIEGVPRTLTLGKHRIIPDLPIEVPSQEAGALFNEGAQLLATNPEGAYDRWTALDKQFPSAPIRVQIARLSQNLGRIEESQEWLNRALELDPESADALIERASQALMMGDLRGALADARIVDSKEALTVTQFVTYQTVQENLNSVINSPIADALMAQADIEGDEESAGANRELAGLLGDMQKTLALTQYLRQRPVMTLQEDLTLAQVLEQMDSFVIENAAWLFGLLPELEQVREEARESLFEREGDETAGGNPDDETDDEMDDEIDDEEMDEYGLTPGQQRVYLERARGLLAETLRSPEKLAEGLPGLPDSDLRALQWLLDRGGVAPLDEFLSAFPTKSEIPADMLLENGIVAEGRLGGRMTRLVPVDTREPLRQALAQVLAETGAGSEGT